MHDSFPRRVAWLAAALLPALATGCLPNATWLPDSSGFVYTGGKNKDALYLYDLEKKAPRVLVEKGAGPAWPAVSADGKRIAVAVRKDDGTRVSLEVIVFDRDGKELHRSAKQDWIAHDNPGINDKTAPQAFWVPEQDKLLLYSDGQTGTYDLKNKSSVKTEMTPATFGASPIRPDGKGYLVVKKDSPGLVFIDWDGKEKEIAAAPKDAFDNQNGGDNPLGAMIYFPLMHSSRWDGSTAVVSWSDLRVKIDAEKLTASLDHIKPAMSADKHVIQDQVHLAGGGVIRAVELTKRYQTAPRNQDDPPFGSYRVEVVKQGAKEAQTLMDGAGLFMIYPSPDGKKAVVKCSKTLEAIFTEATPEADMLYLIDGMGDVTAKIDLSK
jgi:dipeptidyl aminopeptidase/acylaminoacyl peptidase